MCIMKNQRFNLRTVRWKSFLLTAIVPLSVPLSVYSSEIFHNESVLNVTQNQTSIKGVVSDKTGPIIGANVIVKGTSNGVITDLDGAFTLDNVKSGDVIQISFIGYKTKEIKVGSQKILNVMLESDNQLLEEVVVVGYGSQKKVNLTGSVGQIDSKVFESRPITSTTSALQGTIPNLQITNNSGKPGQGASLNVRGTTSINGGAPLVLVDGVEMSLDVINPNDIANITVLKDAAASAIYGVRAAFGVILVTTKNPSHKEKTSIQYTGNFSFNMPSIMPDFIESSSQVAEWINEACFNGKQPALFRQDIIDKIKAYESDPINNPIYEVVDGSFRFYGHSDLKSLMVKDFTTTQRHSLNISGGNEKTRFYTSIGYLDQNGLYKVGNDNFKRLNGTLSIENQTFKWMKLGAKALYHYAKNDEPFIYKDDVWKSVVYSLPTSYLGAWHADSRYPELNRYEGLYFSGNAYALLKDGGRKKTDAHNILLNAYLDLNLLKGWNIHLDINYKHVTNDISNHSKPILFIDGNFNETYEKTSDGYYQLNHDQTNYYSFNAYTDYEKTIGKHYFKTMVGFNQELTKYGNFSGKRQNILNDDVPSLGLGTGNHMTTQTGYEWALRGGFIRLNYIYDNRYLVEFNGRYDGTSRFPSDNRFVFLPSFSAGWRISEEKFMKPTREWLDNMKLRISYGKLGNQLLSSGAWGGNIKYYPYIPFMSNSSTNNWIFGDSQVTYINPGGLVSNSLTWEKVSTINYGIDLTLFNQRLDLSFDYYNRKTSDMLIMSTYPDVLGTTAPPENSAELSTKGWELSVNWHDNIGENFKYDIGFVLSDSQAKILKYTNPTNNIDTYYVGKKVGDIWGYETEGIFQSDDEVKNHADQSQVADVVWEAGDIKYKDLNGDKVISEGKRTLDDHGDLKVIGNTTPRFQYGITGNIEYKNVYLNVFLQGIGRRDFYPSDQSFWPAGSQYYNVQKWFVSDSWTPDNPDAYFAIPRVGDTRNQKVQTRYLQNASYMRMKNLTLGWNLPYNWIKHVALSRASIYISGENLFEFTKVKGPYDPEAALGNGKMIYPFMRTISLGVNLNF